MLRAVQIIFAFSLLVLLTSCDLPNNQEEAESLANQENGEDQAAANSLKNMSHLLLGTGSVQGVYFPIGGVICRLLNRRYQHIQKARC